MKLKVQTAIAVIGLACASAGYAAEDADKQAAKEAAKEAARQVCLTAAQKRYASPEITGSGHRKKVGDIRGYAFKVDTGSHRSTVCVADAKGKWMFYAGRL